MRASPGQVSSHPGGFLGTPTRWDPNKSKDREMWCCWKTPRLKSLSQVGEASPPLTLPASTGRIRAKCPVPDRVQDTFPPLPPAQLKNDQIGWIWQTPHPSLTNDYARRRAIEASMGQCPCKSTPKVARHTERGPPFLPGTGVSEVC